MKNFLLGFGVLIILALSVFGLVNLITPIHFMIGLIILSIFALCLAIGATIEVFHPKLYDFFPGEKSE